jgi:TolB protein
MDADGRNPRNLTPNRHSDAYPSWSPDSKRIAFASNREGDWEIYVMDVDGQNPRNLTKNPAADESQPAWFLPTFAVAPAGQQFTMWGWVKQVVR